ncbi:MFS transporter [Streptacidiphilus sp. EB103A]|uniref:MFS transporter n=1 Tax=Streptacidiphilus sp. EB103A TaxID=3156275 RepID=UPI003512BB87
MATVTTRSPTAPTPTRTPYTAVLRAPHVPVLLAGTLLARLPSAMAPTLVLLAEHHSGAGLATAGALSALQALMASVVQPLLARAADRYGHRPVLTAATTATTLVYLLLALPGTPLPATVVLIALSGLLAPPAQACLRARWPDLVPTTALQCAHALDTSTSELLYATAPLLAAATVYGTGAGTGYLLAAVLGAAGTLVLFLATTVAGTRTRNPRHRDPLGHLRSTDLRWIMGVHAALGAALGTVAMAGLLIATRDHHPSGAGILASCYAAGSLVGGLLFGARAWPGTPATRFLATTTLMALTWIPVVLCPTTLTAALAAVLPGAALAPTLTSGSDLRRERVPDGQAEASGWVLAALGLGEALGLVLAGHWPATWWPALYATTALAAAALWLHRPTGHPNPRRTP